MGYVQSWNLSFQRELDKNTVVDFRYTGNHGIDLWREMNLNEINIVNNGYLTSSKPPKTTSPSRAAATSTTTRTLSISVTKACRVK